MPADEVSTGSDVDAARVRTTGPRHAAPKKPLFTRFHMPAGKAIALAAMPTAVLMGMGFTPTLANAEDQPASKSLTIDEYKDCVAALEGADASASASPSPSASDSASDAAGDSTGDSKDESTDGSTDTSKDTSGTSDGKGGSSSSDSGSDDAAEPSPAASSSADSPEKSATSGDTATASPSATETSKNVLETIGDAITDLFDGKDSDSTATSSPSPSASGSASAGDSSSDSGSDSSDTSGSSGSSDSSGSSGSDSSGTSKDTTGAVTDTVNDAVKDTAGAAEETAKDTTEAADGATASPSPSASATTDAADCPVATDDEGGIDNKIRLPDDPWFLNASSLLLKGADYQGIVKVKTANGTVKEVLKYVISDGTDIGDLHQTVDDKQAGRTYHVQAGKGTTSTIRDGDTIMYTESISGNLFGLIPITFTPKNPPPLNIPLIYFTNVKVQQAGQFGGTLTVPGLHQYTTAD
ncbi:hypothetical protein [Streptomyces sp. NBC_01235]|uniref:hypothetical protein n=1 Tax=Streptomyces sp. NBC_01235 TaxID=2903788 RepID=UPI002E11952F|nr:hypothetical protein OG289_34360 [Streptomyces sp. NBC_01235]